jgi:uncharacterized protein (DUF362 family)
MAVRPGDEGCGEGCERHVLAGRGKALTRRAFLQGALASALLAGCRAVPAAVTPAATSTLADVSTPVPAAEPSPTSAPAPTLAPTTAPTSAAAPAPTQVAPTSAPNSPAVARVTIAQATSYDRALIRQQVRTLLDGLGGLGGVVSAGDRVAVKVNLTGGTYFDPPAGHSATESYLTHPEVVRALLELLHDAGARELYIVEATYDPDSFRLFGYEAVAQELGATLVDLNSPQPYAEFATVPVGEGWFIYPEFTLNPILQDVDAFVSVAKMKCHCRCGVTHSMKNLIGLVPVTHYRLNPEDWWRSALHGPDSQTRTRLPRVVVDLNRARPVNLALIDGVKTGEGGEVPRGSFAPLAPGVLLAGKDPVAADAVATAAMGFDPTVEYPTEPFVNGDNHLNLARGLGLGTNRLEEIEVLGPSIEEIEQPFRPCYSETGMLGLPFV